MSTQLKDGQRTRLGASSVLRSARVILGPPIRRVRTAIRKPWRGKNLTGRPAAEKLKIPTADGFHLSARLYRGAQVPSRAIVLLHGWDPHGQEHGFYLALARRLQVKGYSVLTFNFRGYPGSGSPNTPIHFSSEAILDDIQSAVDSLVTGQGIGADGLYLYGHSYGSGFVLPTMMRDPRVRKGIIQNPSVWIERRLTGARPTQLDFFHERYWRYMARKRPVPVEEYLEVSKSRDLLQQIENCDAAPILLLDGGVDGPETWDFVRRVFERTGPGWSYYSIPHADHFCNTSKFGAFVVEQAMILDHLAEFLDLWLERSGIQ